ADRRVARGDNAGALRILLESPQEGVRAAELKARASELREKAIAEELTRAAREARRRKTWKRAHRRYKYVLELDDQSVVALDGLRALEQRMRRRKIAFSPYRPESSDAPAAPSEQEAIRRQFDGDERLIGIAMAYRRGALADAQKRARRLSRHQKGPRGVTAKAMEAAIKEVRRRYRRIKTEIGNDPGQAWAMLYELDDYERRILPRGVKSFAVRELEVSLSEAFAAGGQTQFEAGRFKEAFQRWESGFKLDATNPKVLAGLKQLEEEAEKLSQEAELAGQRGANDVCDRWKRITRMTRSESSVHIRARKRAISTCR
ncbi:MAG: hypothetical protein AAF449_16860, partial [Myxococcota bacterium]